MCRPSFISEDDLTTFEGWLKYQAIDPAEVPPDLLSMLEREYAEGRARAAAQPKIGRLKLRPPLPGELRYGVAVPEGRDLWLVLWVRRSHRGEFFVMVPRGAEGWDPHTSYHRDGTFHAKSYDMKFGPPQKRQPLDTFKGTEPLGSYSGYAPKSEGAVCVPADFTGIVEVPAGLLGPRHGAVTVDLVELGHAPCEHPWGAIYQRVAFNEGEPGVVITVGRPMGEER